MPILDLLKHWCITMKSLFLFTFKLEKQWNRGNGALIEKKKKSTKVPPGGQTTHIHDKRIDKGKWVIILRQNKYTFL